MKRKTVFFSHTWKMDGLERDNHKRVSQLANGMKRLGWDTWVDETSGDVHGFLDFALASAIQRCDVFAICLTKEYVKKIDEAAGHHSMVVDNCLKEILFARMLCKPVVPIVMEPCMRDMTTWGVVAGMGLGGFVYADASFNVEKNMELHTLLCNMWGGGPLVCDRPLVQRRRRSRFRPASFRFWGGGGGSPSPSSSSSSSDPSSSSSDPSSSSAPPLASSVSDSVLSVRLSL
jgi:hypothetical protein